MFAWSWITHVYTAAAVVALVQRWRKDRANLEDRLLSLSYTASQLVRRDRGPVLSKKMDDIAERLRELLKDDECLLDMILRCSLKNHGEMRWTSVKLLDCRSTDHALDKSFTRSYFSTHL